MKKITALFALLTIATTTFAQDWKVDKGHSKVAFIVQHHGISEVDGNFKKYEANMTATKADLSDATFEMTVETASINTDLDMRDNHLRSEDIFNVEKFPTMTFKSTSLKKKKGNQYVMMGNLTLRGVTKPITLDVTMNGPVENPNKQAKNFQVGIKAVGKIKRSDFSLGSKLTTAFVSDEIQIRVTGEFNKANPNAK
ncbi:MAG: YceI family protein [Saprospiraceae bacterium]|nr:YceI family protein [Saprospiraceae bacterium]